MRVSGGQHARDAFGTVEAVCPGRGGQHSACGRGARVGVRVGWRRWDAGDKEGADGRVHIKVAGSESPAGIDEGRNCCESTEDSGYGRVLSRLVRV